MALTTYTTLQTAVINALHRSDLSSYVPDFITLAEDKANKRLRLRGMETRVTASINSEFLSLPTGFLAMQNFQLNTNPVSTLTYLTPDMMDERTPSGSTGQPLYFTFVGGEIQLAPTPGGTYTAEIDYYKKFDIATDSTNWLLTNAPRIYYHGTLEQAYLFIKDEKRASIHGALLESALRELETSDDTDRIPDAGLAIYSVSVP